jgi:hypothetical protein
MSKDKFKLNDEVINSLGLKLMADLTIHDAALWMVMGTDPDAHEDRCDLDPEYLQYYSDHRYGEAYVLEICGFIQSAVRQGLINANSGGDMNNIHLDINATYINKVSWLEWCQKEGYIAHSYVTSESKVDQEDESKWNIYDSRDPKPEQPWYTPARYFARQLIKDDSTLLTKANVLADKVVQSLNRVGIYKRGGKKPLSATTVKKSFSNVKFR